MMRRIDITDYEFAGSSEPFQVRPSLVAILFAESRLDAREIIRRDELANYIEKYEGDFLLLEEADWRKLLAGLKAMDLQPYGRSIVEFCRRVLSAPQVNIPGAAPVQPDQNDE